MNLKYLKLLAVVDPGFPKIRGANHQGGLTYYFCQIFPANCMKMKEIGPRGECASLCPIRYANEMSVKLLRIATNKNVRM